MFESTMPSKRQIKILKDIFLPELLRCPSPYSSVPIIILDFICEISQRVCL